MSELKEELTVTCEVETVLYPTKEKAAQERRYDKNAEVWTVFRTYTKRSNNIFLPTTFAGVAPHLDRGDVVTVVGTITESKYGQQFSFTGIQKKIPGDVQALKNFFLRNFNGVGISLSDRIVDTLGTYAVEKIENDYHCLEQVPGITPNKAVDIANQLTVMHASIEEMRFFSRTGLGPNRIATVKNAYKDKTENHTKFDIISLISENPYRLIEDVKGIGFKVADAVSLKLGFAADEPKRVRAGIKYALKEEVETKGNIWITKKDLVSLASNSSYLQVPAYIVETELETMLSDKCLINENGRIYLPEYYDLEKYIADKIHSMQKYKAKLFTDDDIENGIAVIEAQKGRTLDAGQKLAVKICANSNVSIVTGGPGTGKTTTLDILLSLLESANMRVVMAAPTGRAAKRMTEQTGRDASTVHALNAKSEYINLSASRSIRHVLVVDETSMVDINVMKMIVDLCDQSTKLIFVGDIDQLPSIGPGQILRDMIDSNSIATAKLTTIHRQGQDSHIIINAHAIINGKALETDYARDFFVLEREDENACLKAIKTLVTKTYPKEGIDPKDIQILAPLRRGTLGVVNLNKEMQALLNPAAPEKEEYIAKFSEDGIVLREGDKVIQTKNDYKIHCDDGSEGVFNGEIGTIVKIKYDEGDAFIFVDFGERIAKYDKTQISGLTLAYAITIHKSQGSEFKVVILPLFMYSMPMIYNRNLLYTAVTRAKEYCCIVGQMDTVKKMIKNNKVNRRRTTLTIRLNGHSDDELIIPRTFNFKKTPKKAKTEKATKEPKEPKAKKEKKTTTKTEGEQTTPKKRGRKKKTDVEENV